MKAIHVFAIVVSLAACAHDRANVSSMRGEPVGVNAVAATKPTGPSPTEMATTAAAGSTVDTRSSIDAGMATSGSTSSAR